MTDKTVQVGVGWSLNVQVSSTDVIDGFIVNHESTVGVLQGGMGSQDGVVWLHDCRRDLGSRVHSELQLGFLSVVDGETFHQQGSETRSSTTTEGVEDQESLKSSALVRQFSESVQDDVDHLLADCVVASGVVVGGIFLSGH